MLQKEIGSNFWLAKNQLMLDRSENNVDMEKFNLQGEDCVFLSTGRAAILFAIKQIKQEKGLKNINALIPSYTCETVLQPFLDEKASIYVYDIDDKLYLNSDKLKSAIAHSHADIVLIHRYFGFNTTYGIDEVIMDYVKKGVVFIEDRTQNLFSSFASLPVQFVVGSFRKWAAIPEGGYCLSTIHKMEKPQKPDSCDRELVNAKLHAFYLKHEYMVSDSGVKSEFLKAYAEAEDIIENEKGFFRMSDESISILNMLDIEALKIKRQQNYQFVYNNLSDYKQVTLLTEKLSDGIVPLYIALKSEKRNQIQAWLRKHDIYAPIIWPKSELIPYVSDTLQQIYNQVLCLPIDQRYGEDEMERMVKIIKKYGG